ncbi:MAG: hypothetical protein PHN64_03605 [Desulfovibrionaceae bacterium]|nr:hypothetical protein [Desulfovibrionaceae bacterium]
MAKKITDAVLARVEKEAAILAKKKADKETAKKLANGIRQLSAIEINKLAIRRGEKMTCALRKEDALYEHANPSL